MSVKRYEPGPTISKAVEFHHVINLSGMTADDTSGGIREQTRQVLDKIDACLSEVGVSRSHVLAATVYLSDIADKADLNEAWNAWIDPDHPPARTCVGASLEGDRVVEITVSVADAGADPGGHGHAHGHGHSHSHGHGHGHSH